MSLQDGVLLKRLAEVGLLAVVDNQVMNEAKHIFAALEKIRPNKSATIIGLASVAMYSGRFDEAIKYLSTVKLDDPEDRHKVNIFLGLAYQGAGRDKEKVDILNKVVAEGDEESKQLAEELLAT